MCQVIAELDAQGRATGRIVGHKGLCVNGIWFDVHNRHTVFLCVHPDNNPEKPASLTRSLSPAAWQEVVAYISRGLNVPADDMRPDEFVPGGLPSG